MCLFLANFKGAPRVNFALSSVPQCFACCCHFSFFVQNLIEIHKFRLLYVDQGCPICWKQKYFHRNWAWTCTNNQPTPLIPRFMWPCDFQECPLMAYRHWLFSFITSWSHGRQLLTKTQCSQKLPAASGSEQPCGVEKICITTSHDNTTYTTQHHNKIQLDESKFSISEQNLLTLTSHDLDWMGEQQDTNWGSTEATITFRKWSEEDRKWLEEVVLRKQVLYLNSGSASFEGCIWRAITSLQCSKGFHNSQKFVNAYAHFKCTLLLVNLLGAPWVHWTHFSTPKCFVCGCCCPF